MLFTLLRDLFDTLGTLEAAAVRWIAYFHEDEAKKVLNEPSCLLEYYFDGVSAGDSDHRTWPDVLHVLLRRFLTDEVLRKAQDAVTRTEQFGT